MTDNEITLKYGYFRIKIENVEIDATLDTKIVIPLKDKEKEIKDSILTIKAPKNSLVFTSPPTTEAFTEQVKIISKRYRDNHPEYDPSKWNKEHPEEFKIIARKSMKKARLLNPEKFKKRDKEQYKKHKENRINGNSIVRNKIRLRILELLGNKCSNPNCLIIGGCTDKRALQIDHVKGGGNKHRKLFTTIYQMYRQMIKEIENGSKDYQLLCANCNMIKRMKNKEYN